MSQSTKSQPKLISRYEFQISEDFKNAVQVFQNEMRLTREALVALKPKSASDGLLEAIQAEAANDAPQPELKQLGQWVFEGQDKKWVCAAVNTTGTAYLHNIDGDWMRFDAGRGLWHSISLKYHEIKRIDGAFDPSGLAKGFVARETVNDVDYLSCEGPTPKDMPTFIAIDEYDSLSERVPHIDDVLDKPNWLSDSVPQITKADLQLIFIKNLSTTLIQRMHSMDRFSEEDYEVGGLNIEPWDIVFGQYCEQDCFAVVMGTQSAEDIGCSKIDIVLLEKSESRDKIASTSFIYFDTNDTYRTITSDEIGLFREALEACYV